MKWALLALLGSSIAASDVPAIESEVFFRGADVLRVLVDPSGARVAIQKRDDVVVQATATGREHSLLPPIDRFWPDPMQVEEVVWVDEDTLVLQGAGEVRVYQFSSDTSKPPEVEKIKTRGRVVDALPDRPDEVLFATLGSERSRVYLESTDSLAYEEGKPDRVPVAVLDGYVLEWFADRAGVVRAATIIDDPDRWTVDVVFRDDAESDWRVLFSVEPDALTELGRTPLGFDGSGRFLVASNEGRENYALYRADVRTGALADQVYEHPTAEIDGILTDYRGGLIGVALFEGGEHRYDFFDEALRSHHEAAQKTFPGKRVHVTSVSRDGRWFTALVESGDDPGEYFLFDAASGEARGIGLVAPWLAGVRLAEVKTLRVASSGGIEVDAFFTSRDHATPPPLIVMPHGGPVGVAENLYYEPVSQFLATSGYAVLRVNYRGSAGYGKTFLGAGARQWGKGIEDDVEASVQEVISRGWVDPDRICIAGSSYGGYSALMAVVLHPDRYRCAATHAGVSDLALLYDSTDFAHTEWGRRYLREVIGDPVEEAERMRESSPVYRVDEIRVPIHIVHGRNDTRVDIEHAARLRRMLLLQDKPYEWHVYESAGHGFTSPEEMANYYRRLRAFFGKHLGGHAWGVN